MSLRLLRSCGRGGHNFLTKEHPSAFPTIPTAVPTVLNSRSRRCPPKCSVPGLYPPTLADIIDRFLRMAVIQAKSPISNPNHQFHFCYWL